MIVVVGRVTNVLAGQVKLVVGPRLNHERHAPLITCGKVVSAAGYGALDGVLSIMLGYVFCAASDVPDAGKAGVEPQLSKKNGAVSGVVLASGTI